MPAVVHIDGTARPQFISQTSHSFGYELISNFKEKTGIPCLINTSFNIHEEPIVSSIGDAITALKEGSVDFVTDGLNIYCLAGTKNESFLEQI
jgi:carbamoyltransferase